jgi:hypothetical protein
MEHVIGSSNYIALVRASASLNKDAKTHETHRALTGPQGIITAKVINGTAK